MPHTTHAPTLTVRPCTPADHAACLAIFNSNVPRYFAAAERDDFAGFLRTADDGYWVVVDDQDGALIGCGGSHVQGTVGRLCWGMVHAARQRRQAGSALLQARLAHLFAQPAVHEVQLDTSQHTAPFFARFGFELRHTEPDAWAPGLHGLQMALPRAAWRPPTTPANGAVPCPT